MGLLLSPGRLGKVQNCTLPTYSTISTLSFCMKLGRYVKQLVTNYLQRSKFTIEELKFRDVIKMMGRLLIFKIFDSEHEGTIISDWKDMFSFCFRILEVNWIFYRNNWKINLWKQSPESVWSAKNWQNYFQRNDVIIRRHHSTVHIILPMSPQLLYTV